MTLPRRTGVGFFGVGYGVRIPLLVFYDSQGQSRQTSVVGEEYGIETTFHRHFTAAMESRGTDILVWEEGDIIRKLLQRRKHFWTREIPA